MSFNFGSASTPTKPAFGAPASAGGFSFGSQPAAGTTNAFGSGAATNAFGGGNTTNAFGGNTTNAFGGNTTNAFGGNTTNAFGGGKTNAFGGGTTNAFGSPPATNSFGFGQQQQQQPAAFNAFGSATTNNMFGSSAFGAGASSAFPSATSAFPSNALAGGAGTLSAGNGQQNQWVGAQKLLDISMAYASKLDASGRPVEVSTDKKESPAPAAQAGTQPAAPTTAWSFSMPSAAAAAPAAAPSPSINKLCEFEVIAYNPSSAYKQKPYVRPPHVGYRRWLQADRDNPDPENLTPVLVVGCDGLKKRFSNQCTKADKIKTYVDGLQEQLQLLERSVDGSALRYEELKERQRRYFMRLLQVMRKLEVLRAKGISLTPVETRYREKVDELSSAITVPYEKIQSLESSQAILERQRESFALPSTVSETDIESLCAVLVKQREGLKHLTEIVKKDARDVMIMEKIINDSTSSGRGYY